MTENVESLQATGERNIGNVARNVGNNMREKRKSEHKFGGAKVCKAEQGSKYFVNPNIENEIFGQYINHFICSFDFRNTEAVARRCTSEYVFLKISQCSQENTCVGVSF